MAVLAGQEVVARARFASPEATIRTFAKSLSGGNLALAVECFAAHSCLVTPDATAVTGRGGIGAVLAQLISQGSDIAIENSGSLIAGELAFVNQRWRIRLGAGDDGHLWDVVPILVLRRVDVEWKFAIAAPWGRP